MSQAWEKVVFGGRGGLILFCSGVAEWDQLIQVDVLSCNHFVDYSLGENWQASSDENLLGRPAGEDVFLDNFASVRLSNWDPEECPKVRREARALPVGGLPTIRPMDGVSCEHSVRDGQLLGESGGLSEWCR